MNWDISPPDEAARTRAKRRWDSIAKPLGSLGLLEAALCDIAALTGSDTIELRPRAVLVFCADNGVTARGVTQTDSAVTGVVARELVRGRSAVCRMAREAGCCVIPVDMGIRDFPGCPGVLNRRIGNG
ncbi:MAG: nicotinate-nucleotide--dimethylbenzimidazole phosphoribosyltransferase, partial [Oscillibacter sp.]|nr:nicotinate-nucleotide--dimethylbenzimidazole phosphoribosyltransferase [Oscillibacter sp.]